MLLTIREISEHPERSFLYLFLALQHNFCSLGAGGRKFVVELLSRHAQLKERKQYRYSGEPEPESVEQKEQEKVLVV